MVGAKIGGRPQNAWTSSRKRKLVRLYSLTTLDKDEIRQVLRDHDFDPCSSDIQKKLRELFPRDYAKEYRKYRPSKDGQINRLNAIKTTSSVRRTEKQSTISLQSPGIRIADFEGPESAFRNYSNDQQLLPRLGPMNSKLSISDSTMVSSSLLLLDGSTISNWRFNDDSPSQQAILPQDPGPQDSRTNPIGASTVDLQQDYEAMVSKPSRNDSLQSIKLRLRNRSTTSISLVQGVLRCSLSSSIRSSMSWRTSWSGLVSIPSIADASESDCTRNASFREENAFESFNLKDPSTVPQRLRKYNHLSADDVIVWRQLINYHDGSLESSKSKRRLLRKSFQTIDYLLNPVWRICCRRHAEICPCCGSLQIHRTIAAGLGSAERLSCFHTINDPDGFGHTPLHYAAQLGESGVGSFLDQLIQAGANTSSRNTKGQTFLHILFSISEFDDLARHFDLLRYLSSSGFAFHVRDYHGQTPILQLFARATKLTEASLNCIDEMFSIMNPQIDVMDNQGFTIGQHLSKICNPKVRLARVGVFLSVYPKSDIYGLSFRDSMLKHGYDWESWVDWLSESCPPTWVDVHGDTALIAMLKCWRPGIDDETSLPDMIHRLVHIGVEIHARDRMGDTALVVAVISGLRPAVQKLLCMSASVYSISYGSTSYYGTGVLSRAASVLRLARKGNEDAKYAKVLTCVALLADHQVPQRSSDLQEWSSLVADRHKEALFRETIMETTLHEGGVL